MSEGPLVFTSKGHLPEAQLRLQVVWSDVETPLAKAKHVMLQKIAALEAAMVAGNGPGFYVAMQELKTAAETHVQMDEIVCNVEHWLGEECVRRQVNIKKLVGENSAGDVAKFG